ncbi:MAG: ABC transporter ATP-binding protein [Sediminibacterium sp.]|jgi:lipopolysaccharide transport system ATP-binding protein|nr:ABC transporter ATP-binding protein [Chitinophagaceae bacterium]MCA6447588.1 ABC transporter ATP-binding protein [Chitinophagaceae bacterium]
MSAVIKVENLSKQYRLGDVGTGTLSHDLKRWWYKVRGKEDPYLRIGETNDRASKSNSDYVWAIKDINFEVEAGEVLGIIGRNGAGKSTLLKILSKTTSPTTGSVKVKGRIASLLEVGTGFHPELTGRENIFLNGAILGMTKREVQSKFEEIVDFSGVERYIDTPVKRYSSGMYVRLAFAVAAYLEPDILIVDEVLAVGDAEFQKKCLGRMKDVSMNEGRTVLFVSHNMAAVQKLCTKGLLLVNGLVESTGDINKVVDHYVNSNTVTNASVIFTNETIRSGNGNLRFLWVKIEDDNSELRNEFSIGENLNFSFQIKNNHVVTNAELAVQIKSSEGMPIFHMMCRDSNFKPEFEMDVETFNLKLEDIRLFPGIYNVTLTCANTTGHEVYDNIEEAITFTILDGGIYTSRYLPKTAGLIFMNPEWIKK